MQQSFPTGRPHRPSCAVTVSLPLGPTIPPPHTQPTPHTQVPLPLFHPLHYTGPYYPRLIVANDQETGDHDGRSILALQECCSIPGPDIEDDR